MYLSFSDFISSAIRVVLAPTALKLGGVANFKIVFLVVGFGWLVKLSLALSTSLI